MLGGRALAAGLAAVNGFSLSLALRRRSELRSYLSAVTRRYYDAIAFGLPGKFPLAHLEERGVIPFDASRRVQLPTVLHGGGGTSTEEVVHLASLAAVLQPKCILEIGTFTGLTTVAFILNSPPETRIISMDLPPDADVSDKDYIGSDVKLVERRRVGHFVHVLGLVHRYEQLLCDSTQFDPEPLAGQVDLAFIDGSHALPYVINDTEKVASMLSDEGLVLWHDYSGVGVFRPLAAYLEALGRRAPIYRIPDTTLAWAMARDLKTALGRNADATGDGVARRADLRERTAAAVSRPIRAGEAVSSGVTPQASNYRSGVDRQAKPDPPRFAPVSRVPMIQREE